MPWDNDVRMTDEDISFSEIKMLKDMLLKTGRFTTIVFDIGSAALTDLSVFNCFERIFMPALSDDISRNKIEVFLKLIRTILGRLGFISYFCRQRLKT